MERAPTFPPPDRNTRKPTVPLPAGSCDCHAHVFGPQNLYPYLPDAGYIMPVASTEDYIEMLTTIGCSRAVIVQPSVYGNDHRATLDAVRSGKFAFRAVAVPSSTASDKDLEDMHASGVRGIRVNLASLTKGLTIADVPRLADRIKGMGWHLQFYVDINKITDLEAHVGDLPVNVVIDHFGLSRPAEGVQGAGFQRLLNLLRRDNVWAKLIGPYRISDQVPRFPDVTPLARAMVAVAPDRLVWGTDWPHPNDKHTPNCGDLADMVADWIPDEAVRRRILVENPVRLYDF